MGTKTNLLVIGVDAAAWSIIKPNLTQLKNFKKLMSSPLGYYDTINLKEPPKSASVWCSMFSGKTPKQHKHLDFHKNGEPISRDDINVKFIWDILDSGYVIRALQIPFVFPPYNFNCSYKPPSYGLITDLKEMEENLKNKYKLSLKILRQNPDIFIVVFTCLDQLSHFYWSTPLILKWYRKIDSIIGKLIRYANKAIIISDHGFCDWKKSKINTLPRYTKSGREIKGDHSPEAIIITKNIKYRIKKPQDVFYYIKKEFSKK